MYLLWIHVSYFSLEIATRPPPIATLACDTDNDRSKKSETPATIAIFYTNSTRLVFYFHFLWKNSGRISNAR